MCRRALQRLRVAAIGAPSPDLMVAVIDDVDARARQQVE
jgi:hypothetical protein